MSVVVGEPDEHGLCFRQDLVVMAAHILKALGHSKFDILSLEWNAPAFRTGGGINLDTKANSLADYALKNPDRLTPAGEPLHVAVVLRAAALVTERGATGGLTGEQSNFRFHLDHAGYWREDDPPAPPQDDTSPAPRINISDLADRLLEAIAAASQGSNAPVLVDQLKQLPIPKEHLPVAFQYLKDKGLISANFSIRSAARVSAAGHDALARRAAHGREAAPLSPVADTASPTPKHHSAEPLTSGAAAPRASAHLSIFERFLVFASAVIFLAVLLAIAIFFPTPTPFQYQVFRIVLALAAGGFAGPLTGFLHVDFPQVKAGGALAVFVIVYSLNPAALVEPGPEASASRARADAADLRPLIEQLAGQHESEKSALAARDAVLGQWKEIQDALSALDSLGNAHPEERKVAEDHILEELDIIRRTVGPIPFAQGRGLVLQLGPNLFSVTFPVPMLQPPKVTIPIAHSGATAEVEEVSTIGARILFKPLSAPVSLQDFLELHPAFSAEL